MSLLLEIDESEKLRAFKENMAPDVDEDTKQMEEVMRTRLEWGQYQTANMLTREEADMITQFSTGHSQTQQALLNERGEQCAQLFINILTNINKTDVQRYILTIMDNIVSYDDKCVQLFLNLSKSPYTALFRLLSKSDVYTLSRACHILAVLLCASKANVTEQCDLFIQWCYQQLQALNTQILKPVLGALMLMLRSNQNRLLFHSKNGIFYLVAVLRMNGASTQIIYNAAFCIWLLSFNEVLATAVADSKAASILMEMIRTNPKEKIVRITLAIIKNCMSCDNFAHSLIEIGAPKLLTSLRLRKWSDEDIDEDLKTVYDALMQEVSNLSSFEVYRAEVTSGNLDWTPVHTAENFWQENTGQIASNDSLLRILIDLLRSSADPRVLAVACHDLGQFVRYHPRGKAILQELNGKTALMALMSHQEPRVRKESLLAVQKMMVTNWEFLQSGAPNASDNKAPAK